MRNGLTYLYTFDSKLNLQPLFLKKDYIEQLQFLNRIDNEDLINKFLLLGLVEPSDVNLHTTPVNDIPNHIDFLYAQAFSSRTPIECKMELTYACNLGCRFCLEKGLCTQSIMTFGFVKDVLIQLKEIGVVKLFLTGGEIFLLPNIMQIITFACELGFLVILQTNATLLDENIIKILSTYENIRLNISFHGADANIFDNFVQKTGAYAKVTENLGLLESYNVKILLVFNVTADNRKIYNKTLEWFNAHNYNYQVNYEIYPNFVSGDSNSQYATSEYDLTEYFCKRYFDKSKDIFEHTACDAAIMKMRISPDGEVFPCGLIRKSMGNVKEQRILSIWESDTAHEIITYDIQPIRLGCESCKYLKYCSKCNAMFINGNWGYSKPLYCYKAKELYKIFEEKNNENFACKSDL